MIISENISLQDSASRSPFERPTFGPFFYANQKSGPPPGKRDSNVSAVFVFLRSIGKVYFDSRFEHTFSLPFIVRNAWPVTPHGLLIQRVLEPAELYEAELTYHLLSLKPIRWTSGTIGNAGSTTLIDEAKNSTKPLKPVHGSYSFHNYDYGFLGLGILPLISTTRIPSHSRNRLRK
ncbi:MAG: hypothetical protein NXY57DRAFT_53240 [Lentinula lateritia]|nr:MAG: hypothetical protein NXY57DRAFT_53240 [Lentinula lateritia]